MLERQQAMAIDDDKLPEDDREVEPPRDRGEDDDDQDSGEERVEVIFKGNRRVVYCNPKGVPLRHGAYIIVEADKGEDLGRVGLISPELRPRRKGKKLDVQREANEQEIDRWRGLRDKEVKAFHDFQSRVERRRMPMKPVDVEYQYDGRKICFYFTADHRVDFRELVRELAGVYRTRIELRQIGVRDEAKRIGGLGPCGRALCCSTFMSDFSPISSQMARDQNLSLNPSKLSGLCGRLKCCLRFEHDFYRAAQSIFPRLGTRIVIDGKEGQVNRVDFFRDEVSLKMEDGEEITAHVGQIRTMPRKKKG